MISLCHMVTKSIGGQRMFKELKAIVVPSESKIQVIVIGPRMQ